MEVIGPDDVVSSPGETAEFSATLRGGTDVLVWLWYFPAGTNSKQPFVPYMDGDVDAKFNPGTNTMKFWIKLTPAAIAKYNNAEFMIVFDAESIIESRRAKLTVI